MNVTLLPRRFYSSFVDDTGRVCELRDPAGSPTGRQPLKLNVLGALPIVEPSTEFEPISKGETAPAIDCLAREGCS